MNYYFIVLIFNHVKPLKLITKNNKYYHTRLRFLDSLTHIFKISQQQKKHLPTLDLTYSKIFFAD